MLFLIADILTPSDSWKPFVRFTAGLIFLFWVLSPIKQFFGDPGAITLSLTDELEKWVSDEKKNADELIESMSTDQSAYILEQSEDTVLNLIEDSCNCEINEVVISEKDQAYSITLSLSENSKNQEALLENTSELLGIPTSQITILY
nr:stage III sporulation protein AF [Jeotgalibacillus terrae]